MHKHLWGRTSIFFIATLALSLFVSACQPNTGPNSNANIKTTNANASETNANANSSSTSKATIEAREPEQYRATITLKFETTGDQKLSAPPLTAQVTRSGSRQRLEFALPNGEKLVYLDLPDKRLVIAPGRKQYAELTPEATGFEVRRLMTPAQIVAQLKNLDGYERVGEEQIGGRTAIKYHYAGTAKTNTQAGNIQTETNVFVDKDTGLPLRSETVSESTAANVKGVKGLRLVTEMSDIQTDVDQTLFSEPTDMKKVEPEQVRQQVETVFNAAIAIVKQLMQQNAQTGSNPAASPTATPTSVPAK